MKRLHRMIIGAFVGPLAITFVIVLFILVMQFLWKYVDDLMGKGLEWYVLLELMTYATASFVPLALPLAILLSSIMTMGGLGENSELVPMRSAGLGLLRIISPLALTALVLAVGSFYFSNNVLPVANLRFHSLLWDVTRKKPAMNLQPGIFYNGIDGFSIRAMKKEADGGVLHDVLIYDHRAPLQGNRTVVRAKSGTMQRSTDGRYLILTLQDGHFYDEHSPAGDRGKYPMMRGTFEKDEIRLDLTGLGLDRTDRDLFKDHYKMLTLGQLAFAQDSLKRQMQHRTEEQRRHLANSLMVTRKDEMRSDTLPHRTTAQFLEGLPPAQRANLYDVAVNMVRNNINFIERSHDEYRGRREQVAKFDIEWHRKPMLAFACLLFFFIGAPLGAIIRKGGMGLPVVFAIVFFLIFHILSFSTEKLVISGKLEAWPGMWISTFVLLPIGALLTWKATTDSPLFDADAYYRGWERLRSLFKRPHAHSSTL
ncbi:MAG: LptF/LptG family permease [Flavobacteriales bacterium]|jgi:lipopolysaccharide export system permease protein|nr:LptF/LptG family permease [Flavobacteriales bacterium]MBK7101532.1 LptF/LptG family permease [Flavobacteriales bacterium]MBK7112238.1 LptF/LptG family permease [Flavobacteriales bacterium]MBK7481756.1 LptF/LptG family permease [Flavobacteriales bacterium]MBK7618740.1 LptF/LptG family permease [Flavobacteriales bacterium]